MTTPFTTTSENLSGRGSTLVRRTAPAPVTPRRHAAGRLASAVASIVVVAGLSGCAVSDIPPQEKEAINLGVNAEAGPVEVENLLLVTRGEGKPARLIGVLLNTSDTQTQVTLSDQDDEVSLTLQPGQQYAFHDHPTLFKTADDIPGALANVTIAVGEDTESVRIPIRNGSLNWLKPYLPASDGN